MPSPILDLGCGVGRVLVHLQEEGVELYGCDLNAAAIAWCRDNLTGDFRTNDLRPPLPYEDGFFGLVYAISVFTHLPEDLQRAWITELRRVVRPDGVVLITTHGESTTTLLTESELRRFREGQLVVRGALVAGSNRCVTYHPDMYLRQLTGGSFEIVSTDRDAISGQDLVTLRPAARSR